MSAWEGFLRLACTFMQTHVVLELGAKKSGAKTSASGRKLRTSTSEKSMDGLSMWDASAGAESTDEPRRVSRRFIRNDAIGARVRNRRR